MNPTHVDRDAGGALTSEGGLDRLGIDGFSFGDLFQPARLRDLTDRFFADVAADDPELAEAFDRYRVSPDLPPPEESDLLVRIARHLDRFIAVMFGIEDESAAMRREIDDLKVVFEFKKVFIKRRVLKKFTQEKPPSTPPDEARSGTERILVALDAGDDPDDERQVAAATMRLLELEQLLQKPTEQTPDARLRIQALGSAIGVMPSGADDVEAAILDHVLGAIAAHCFHVSRTQHAYHGYDDWVSFHGPEPIDYQNLVQIERPFADRPEIATGPQSHLRRRDGFKLSDPRMPLKNALDEIDYCIYCHEREKDSCARGILDADGKPKPNPLGIPLTGCPLDERISEMHVLKRDGYNIGSLAMIALDNPMCAGTGHRICNDCMKSCIFQKQSPVNIPQIETRVLTDVLELPYGFEIYGLLTRWNPLSIRRPHPLPYNGENVLIVGLGPAGYTLAHFLCNEGFGIVGVDGLKIEHFPAAMTGIDGTVPSAIRDIGEIATELDDRVLAGFGGVSEYGITVRWDKNFLTVIHLTLARRSTMRVYGGVRFGGTLRIEDAWDLGFDHIAIASGAGRPTFIRMQNNLIRGVRKASDFLMALQLTGAFKRTALANLQVRLPAVVIGGGLTAIDTATELMSYYVVQCEKLLDRVELLESEGDRDALERLMASYDAEERGILDEFLTHGRALRAERARAADAGERPDFATLVRAWGGVTIAYRKAMQDSPAYRLNHEEIIKALEEGIYFAECIDPREAIPDEFGAISALRLERMTRTDDGKWANSGEFLTIPARAMFIAAGTHPNTIYEKEHPGTFERDKWGEYFSGFAARRGDDGTLMLEPDPNGVMTSYRSGDRLISFYGDNHPVYAGNVVKAMASAKKGYQQVVDIFQPVLDGLDPNLQSERDEALAGLFERLDDLLIARVVRVDRLTPTIVEVIVRAPLAAREFHPGQFYRLQNFERSSPLLDGTRLMMEGIALTGAWVERESGLLSLIVLEMGASSRLCAHLQPGEEVIVMGPTGTPTEIPTGETVLLAGGGLGNAVLFSIARALTENGNRVLYFAGYKNPRDVFKRDDIEAGTEQVVWASDVEPQIVPRRPQDLAFVGNIVACMKAYADGELGHAAFDLKQVDRIIAIGSDRMMAAVKAARHGVLAPYLRDGHVAIGSINSTMQCMMKEICAQCLQKHVDPVTGKESIVFSCFNQDQLLDEVDFGNLATRLKMNSVQEKLSNAWLSFVLARA